ncbi:NACHT domain-containing protein [Paenibacillus nicotianae]|uniref:NACHT domain-containing protein n=1 Tax=Paenibacillus nicotianae TaxID=1526551 RepID=A0ABW4UQH3_9BACL
MGYDSFDYSKLISDLVSRNVTSIAKGVTKISRKLLAEFSIEIQTAFINYLNSCIHRYSNVKTILNRQTPIPLYEVFVNSNLECKEKVISTKNINELLDVSTKIMILGSGGIGKSTLFKHLFLNSLKETDKIPIFITLRDINSIEYNLIDFIYHSMSILNFNLEKEHLVNSFNKGIYIFFFDGLDEVNEKRRQIIIRELNDFSTQYSYNHFLVSSRISDELSGGWDNYTDFRVSNLTDEQALELVSKMPYEKEIKDKFSENLSKGLYQQHQTFYSNPLLLTLMLMTFEEYAEIPDKIYLFYSQAYEVLYSKHDSSKTGYYRERKTQKNNLGFGDFTKILEIISAHSYFKEEISFTGERLIELIEKAKIITRQEFLEEDFKDDLVVAVCILYLDGLKYNYQHRSFQEYFTAKYILEQSPERQKQLLENLIYNKPSSIFTDQVFRMLMDINRTTIEKYLIIPFLKSIQESIQSFDTKINHIDFITKYALYPLKIIVEVSSYKGKDIFKLRNTPFIEHWQDNGELSPVELFFKFISRWYKSTLNINFDIDELIPGRIIYETNSMKNVIDYIENNFSVFRNDLSFEDLEHDIEHMLQRVNENESENSFAGISLEYAIENVLADPILTSLSIEYKYNQIFDIEYSFKLLKFLEQEHIKIEKFEEELF